MTGFSADWLALREPHDAAARAASLLAKLPAHPERARRPIVDLAAGTAANLRYLAPRLGGAQQWLLVDHDPSLLARVEPALRAWAARLGARVASRGTELIVAAQDFECRVGLEALDLAAQLDRLVLPAGALVTCSALLDLVSEAWVRTLADRCHAAWADVAFALTYDGRMVAAPGDAFDGTALELFNRHQRGDKGFGPALGPEATETAASLFADQGYVLASAASDWRLGAEAVPLQAALFDGWHGAAIEMDPASRAELDAWHARRSEHLRAGATLTVGHRDLVGWLVG